MHDISPSCTCVLSPKSSYGRLSDAGGEMEFSLVSQGSIPQAMLDPSDGKFFFDGSWPLLLLVAT